MDGAKAADSARKPRRALRSVVNEGTIRKTLERLNSVFDQARYSVPPPSPADREEEESRELALAVGRNSVLVASLAYLTEREPAVARAIVQAGREYTEQRLRGEKPSFVVGLRRTKPAPAWMMYPALIQAHQLVVETLEAAWKKPIEAPVGPERFVTNKGRFGIGQMKGTRRRTVQRRHRVTEVVKLYRHVATAIYAEAMPDSNVQVQDIDERMAGRWVDKHKTPARISYCLLARLIRKTPRLVKKWLDEGGRYMRESEQRHRLLDLWGFRPADPDAESVKTPGLP